MDLENNKTSECTFQHKPGEGDDGKKVSIASDKCGNDHFFNNCSQWNSQRGMGWLFQPLQGEEECKQKECKKESPIIFLLDHPVRYVSLFI